MFVPTIHVHSSSDKATVNYVRFMWETMRKLATHPDALKLSVHCIGPTARDRLADLPNSQTFSVKDLYSTGLEGSMGHAQCVEQALSIVDDGDIHIIVDSDTVVLAKGWDDYVRHEIIDKKVGTFGTTYEDIGGFNSGGGSVQTYKNAPNVVWMALSPFHKWKDLKAKPQKSENVHVSNEGMSKIYGLPVGHYVLCDVGWQVPEYLANRDISSFGMKQLKPSTNAIVLKGLNDYHEEYHTLDGIAFVAHQRGSLRHQFREGLSGPFYARVEAYINNEAACAPHWSWTETDPDVVTELMRLKNSQATEIKTRVAELTAVLESLPPAPVSAQPVAPENAIEGWLKATLDGNGIWSRYALPVPKTITCNFYPDATTKNMRLEGNVNGIEFLLPGASTNPHLLTVRNMTQGHATMRVEGSSKVLVVPKDACWLVMVDVDGVVHVN